MDHRATLVVLLRQRLESLLEAMPAAQSGDVRSVHQARVATRRLREALPVVRKSVDAEAVERARARVRRMTRALGPVRELDVSLQLLDELAKRNVGSPRAIACVRDAVTKERLVRRRRMLDAITPGKVDKLRRNLTHVGSGPPVGGKPAAIQEAARQVFRRARTLTTAIVDAGGLYVPARLHAVRIAAKKLRYAMELERELRRSRVTARIRQLKMLQDLLGHMHDLVILIERTRQLQADAAGRDRQLAEELGRLMRAIEEDCRKDHALYMRRRASILKLCSTIGLGEESRPTAVA